MNKSIYSYLIAHTAFLFVICFWYFFGNLYFGYELGDILIIFLIFILTIVSGVIFIYRKKIHIVFMSIFITISFVIDIILISIII